MRIAVFHGPGRPLTIEQVPEPTPRPDEILVEIARCGICGSDISMTNAGPFCYADGRALGHEYAGRVIEVGHAVSEYRVGDQVACVPSAWCGTCDACHRGHPLLCRRCRPLSHGFAEYIAVPATSAVKLPASMSLTDGALVEPMACGLHALRMAGINRGDRVLVLGAGSMALSVVFWARVLGAARIAVQSRSGHRAEVARAMGADAVEGFQEDGDARCRAALGAEPDIVAECVGHAGLLKTAIERVRLQGTVVSMGMCMQPEMILPAYCAFKDMRLLFPLGYTVAEFTQTARAFDAGHVRPESMVSDVISLEALPAMFESLRAGRQSLKVHVNPHMSATHD
jgi:(R,R)-butanediol dehydrogenase/meso-butanediol dehydrogenase/diacetyl reductase